MCHSPDEFSALYDRAAAHALNDSARYVQQSFIGHGDHHVFGRLAAVIDLVNDNIVYGSGGMTYTYDGVSTFYPAAGYLNGLTQTDAGATVRVWTAALTTTPSSTANMLGYSLLGTLSTSTKKNNEGSRAGFGLPVRCMKI